MKALLLATHNKAKLAELKLGVSSYLKGKVEIVSLNDLNIKVNPKETGQTFQENSFLKAKFYANLSKLPTIADDGGLIIPSLNNEPGVKSRRWLGYEASDEKLITYTLDRLKGSLISYRTAYLETCLCFYYPLPSVIARSDSDEAISKNNEIPSLRDVRRPFARNDGVVICEQEKIKGHIAKKSSGRPTKGYPFRALFVVEKYNKYYDELTDRQHHEINHRLIALKRLLNKAKKYLLE